MTIENMLYIYLIFVWFDAVYVTSKPSVTNLKYGLPLCQNQENKI